MISLFLSIYTPKLSGTFPKDYSLERFFKGLDTFGDRVLVREIMKVSATIICIYLTLFLWCAACSTEEPPPPPVKKHKVTMSIKEPAPEKAKTPLANEEEKGKIEVKEAGEVKTAAVEEKVSTMPETDAGEKETAVEEVTGYHTVKKGDSLSAIAARTDVYGDPLKWPILYRLNIDKIGELQLVEDFLDRELPEGVMLKIITPDEARENLKSNANKIWSINVLSGTTRVDIIPSAIMLIRNGYPVYITSAKVKGKDWMRLRVGFFKNKIEADAERKEIMTLLNLDNSWVTKVVQKELEEFGGY